MVTKVHPEPNMITIIPIKEKVPEKTVHQSELKDLDYISTDPEDDLPTNTPRYTPGHKHANVDPPSHFHYPYDTQSKTKEYSVTMAHPLWPQRDSQNLVQNKVG